MAPKYKWYKDCLLVSEQSIALATCKYKVFIDRNVMVRVSRLTTAHHPDATELVKAGSSHRLHNEQRFLIKM